MQTTKRTLELMRERGYTCQVVEHWNAFAHIRQDLFGFIDVLCVRDEDIVGVQCTSWDETGRRVAKIVEHDKYPLVCKAIRIIVQGWHKKAGRWVCKEVEL